MTGYEEEGKWGESSRLELVQDDVLFILIDTLEGGVLSYCRLIMANSLLRRSGSFVSLSR